MARCCGTFRLPRRVKKGMDYTVTTTSGNVIKRTPRPKKVIKKATTETTKKVIEEPVQPIKVNDEEIIDISSLSEEEQQKILEDQE